MNITWNIVTENMTWSKSLEEKLRQKINKLETHLQHYPPDAVHLQILLERSAKKPWHTAALTLRLPHNILQSKKAARDIVPAFDVAVRVMLRELETAKSKLRREDKWKRKDRRRQLHAAKITSFAAEPMAGGSGPQNLRDVVAELLEREDKPLLRHVRRLLRYRELRGELPLGAIDPREVIDEVVRQALAAPSDKPDRESYRVWLYDLVRHEVQNRIRAWCAEAREKVSIESETTEPDPHTSPPDAEAARKDWLEHLQVVAQRWPEGERSVFELYFLEGFEPDEVAMLLKRPQQEIDMLIGAVQTRLRWELAHEVE
jgi:ribosomal subunit interface protein